MIVFRVGRASEEWGLISNDEDEPDGLYTPIVRSVPANTAAKSGAILRARADLEVVSEASSLAFLRCLSATDPKLDRQIMEIKPQWLLEVAPHYFKPADLEQLAKGDRKMPKTLGKGEEKTR